MAGKHTFTLRRLNFQAVSPAEGSRANLTTAFEHGDAILSYIKDPRSPKGEITDSIGQSAGQKQVNEGCYS